MGEAVPILEFALVLVVMVVLGKVWHRCVMRSGEQDAFVYSDPAMPRPRYEHLSASLRVAHPSRSAERADAQDVYGVNGERVV